ncbi:helix-turn-helix domain-containing protein [Streptomyces sp. TLI_171]|uniref:helix-turn-helix domain-containing protein n=1 Tax=Streptomyces sp. TLI_171 TaxID=1938859 RepID=UPI000C1A4F6F|nr:helix-turn-helix domain-containing protein [Streptomyces sp. TLI_171]RKE22572.1 TetR family transcriptional regulator [Streptomyces sp. TLI_171]
MGRPRAFDEAEAVRDAAVLFAERGFEGTSVDDLVQRLGVHRGSLYKVFGSKRGLYLAALRHHLDQEVLPTVAALGAAGSAAEVLVQAAGGFDGGAAAGLLLSAAVEQAAADPDTAALVAEGLAALEAALRGALGEAEGPLAQALCATVLGTRVRDRAAGAPGSAAAVLALAGRLGA